MTQENVTLSVLKALADNVRLTIVRILSSRPDGSSMGCDIAKSCASLHDIAQPTMSHHLAKLVEAGVISEQKDGTSKSYTLNREYLARLGVDVDKL